ncbi:M28 family peptidase [Pontibacter cellulosilyticus]|uniref:M28 family peptidase n=1 Tax=Pontibacter cellulosilyticus TaxID=1720253 RepID=A0A923N7U6_9BACT|nr:M28 family peptidase [Pontibacter cellulosilyticus]MBC5993813.1 M28 family peptidase [Pontibacter cellulosilyticus]
MKHFRIFLFFILVATGTASAQNMERVRQTVDTLASPYFHGRGYILDGDARAADYIRDRFKQMGLKPLGNSYFQSFSFPVNRITETPQLEIDGKKLLAGKDFVARASSPSGSGKAAILVLDSLALTDAAAAQQFFSQNFKGKAIVYRQQDAKPISQLPQPYQQKLQQAAVHIILQPKALLTTVAHQAEATPMLEVLSTAWPAKAQSIKYSIKSSVNPNHQAQNVIGYIEGSTKPDSFLVFTAHYDHLGGQGKEVYFPGANDNASGTAMLLELAAHFSKPENKPKYSMAFIAFAAEEAGLLGSFYYVHNPLFPLRDIRFLVNLDLLGTGDEGMMVVNGQVHKQEFELLSSINQKYNYLPQIKSRGKAANSDHYPFSEQGVPAFFFYTLGGTAAYHNTQDFANQLPLTRFADVFKLITSFTEHLQKTSKYKSK